jgi:Fe2+ or Zn2+ uptake regulation protein
MRTNVYKKEIVKVLKENHLLSIADIHKQIPGVDYSTVYRNITQLLDDGDVRKIIIDKATVMYEVSGHHNHDHFVCTDCGDIQEVTIPLTELSIFKHYHVNDLLVRGLCKDCNQNV